jgi:beta-1,4-mannosyl-glycoprotein beta-1,4-N-acetylglucosaminyltransferase
VGVARGLAQIPGLTDDDFVVHSDLDEIIDPELLKAVRAGSITHDHNTLEMDMYYYNMTSRLFVKCTAPSLLKVRIAKTESRRTKMGNLIRNAGWHLSYFGDSEFIQNKIKHFSHQEYNTPEYTDLQRIQSAMDNCVDLYGRPNESIQHIPICKNDRLPPRMDLLTKYWLV